MQSATDLLSWLRMENLSLPKFLLIAMLQGLVSMTSAQHEPIRIGAASDLKFALDSALTIFRSESGVDVTVTYGSSGKLFEQISSGAPFDIFFSADFSYPEMLRKAGIAVTDPKLYGRGRLVVWSSLVDPSTLKMRTLIHEKIRKVAIANPQHAPYGKRAVEALTFYDLYDNVKPKLVLGENISQASQYLYSGAADAGIIALSLALSPPMKKLKGNYYIIPEESHLPLDQAYVLLSSGKGNEESLANLDRFLVTDRCRDIFKLFGFNLPPEKSK
jgi:molybdate transport system substrate-binding protein